MILYARGGEAMPATKKLVFDSKLLPDGHLYCPEELADKKNLHFKVVATYEIETKVIKTIKSLPDDATWDDIQERVNFVAGVRKGIQELDEGQAVPHQKMKEEFEEWLSR
jgi:predicted transcriptional regulator